jgi:hypothetical protein
MNKLENQVNNALKLYEEKNIPALQQQLHELYSNFNRQGGGTLIINYPQKEQLAECFTMMLRFDWMNDADIREVWAENGFYCIIEYINSIHTNEDQIVGGLDLFLHLCYGKRGLIPQIKDILEKAQIRNEFVFDENDYNNGVEYVINQFMFLSAQIIKPLVLKHKNVLSGDIKKCFNEILDDKTYYNLLPEEIFMKAKFISRIIEHIIENAN